MILLLSVLVYLCNYLFNAVGKTWHLILGLLSWSLKFIHSSKRTKHRKRWQRWTFIIAAIVLGFYKALIITSSRLNSSNLDNMWFCLMYYFEFLKASFTLWTVKYENAVVSHTVESFFFIASNILGHSN